ncbi:MAG: hypothetical protein ABI697_03340 [Devosia sp.]
MPRDFARSRTLDSPIVVAQTVRSPPRPSDCVVFFTHLWDARIASHFARLKREMEGILPVFLAVHLEPGASLPAGLQPDIVVDGRLAMHLFPARFAACVGHRTGFKPGYVDLLWLAALLQPSLANFDRLWVMEYDVDFSGVWSRFFTEAAGYDADLLATHLRFRRDDLDWVWLNEIADPDDHPDDHIIGLLALARLSRIALSRLALSYRHDRWAGHFELIIPTVISRLGLRVADLGGNGSFTDPSRRGRWYDGTSGLEHDPFGVGTPRSDYFAESPAGYAKGRLYHPVKPGWFSDAS